MSEKVKEILDKLDPANDNHWTTDGQPKLEIIRLLSGDAKVSREQVVAIAPTLTRESLRKEQAAKFEVQEASTSKAEPEPGPAPVVNTPLPAGPTLASDPVTTLDAPVEAEKSNMENVFVRNLQEETERLAYLLKMKEELLKEIALQEARVDSMVEESEDGAEPEHIRNQRCIGEALQASLRRNEARAALIAEHGPTRQVKTVAPSPLDQALARSKR